MSFTEDLLNGLCQFFVNADDLSEEYKFLTGTDVYQDDDRAIAWEVTPDLDRVITVKTYPVGDDPSISDSVVGVQFKVSGPGDMVFVNHALDDLFDLFHGLQATTMGGVKVVQAQRRSGASLGQDGSGRVSRSENYYFTVHRPSRNRT